MILKKVRNIIGIIILFMLCLGTAVQANAKEIMKQIEKGINGYQTVMPSSDSSSGGGGSW
jgi:outer membrane lipoprotein-sorting protein